MSNKKEFALSPSRIMSYVKCSYVYYMENTLMLDSGKNFGNMRGSVLHEACELLIKEKYKKRVQKIIDSGSISSDPALIRYLKIKGYQEGLRDEFDHKGNNNFEMICDMLYVVLSNDFYCEGWDIDYDNLEVKFTLRSEEPEYVIRGLIDKPTSRDGVYKILDYKSSQSKKSKKDLEMEIQALCYILYCIRGLKAKDATVDFVFARFPDDPIDRIENISKKELEGFEHYLSDLYSHLKDFDKNKASENLAAEKGYIKDGGFEGKVMCGYAQYEGHSYPETHKDKDKRGKPYYCCPYKFAFTYYSQRDIDGNIVKSSKNLENLEEVGKYYITEEQHDGCPAFKSV